MKNIIIPVDFSKESENALKAGAMIAKRHNSKLHVLHMLELSDSILTKSDTENANKMFFLFELAKKKFGEFLDKDYLEGVDVEAVVKKYKVYREVDEVSSAVNADLIIMGSQGLTAQDGIFAGSNSEKMVRNSSTPVLIIKEDPQNMAFKSVLMGTDLSEESVSAYQRAQSLFDSLGTKVNLVYVNRPYQNFMTTKEFTEKRKAFAAAGGTENVDFIAGNTVEDGLIQYAEQIQADCIAASTRAKKGLNHFFNGSISEDLANHAKLPVMTFKI